MKLQEEVEKREEKIKSILEISLVRTHRFKERKNAKKNCVDIDILITPRNWDQKEHAAHYNNKWVCHENEEVEPVQPVQMKIYQSNTYRIELSLLHLYNEPKIKKAVSERSTVPVSPACLTYPSSNQEHYPDMATVLLARLNGKFVEVKRKITRKEVHRTKQSFNYIGSSFKIKEKMQDPQSNLEEKESFRILKDNFP